MKDVLSAITECGWNKYACLESITWDNYPRYVMTTDKLLQKRNGIQHVNIADFMLEDRNF